MMNTCINSWIIRPSPIDGVGVFATRIFEKAETISNINGQLIFKRSRTYAQVHGDENCIQIRRRTLLDRDLPTKAMNHSREANVGFTDSVLLTAIRRIEKDEELTLDYSCFEDDARFTMKCKCGTGTCRSEVRSVHFLPLHVFMRYEPYMIRYFCQVYIIYHEVDDSRTTVSTRLRV